MQCVYKIRFLFVVLMMIILTGHAQSQENRDAILIFSGRIINEQTGTPIKFAHVINQTWSHLAISDTLGYFRIRVRLNDLLIITSIGFYDLPIYIYDSIVAENRLHIYHMIPKIYSLSGVNVLRLGTYEQFKYNFLKLELPEPEHPASTLVLQDIEQGIDTLGITEPSSLGSPITAIYNRVSKEGKSLRKLKKVKEEEEFWKQVEYKYNPEMLSRITGLQGPELFEFINFCNFSHKFILESSEYEIIKKVLDKLKEYREQESGMQGSWNK
jgi:hypothetical protein